MIQSLFSLLSPVGRTPKPRSNGITIMLDKGIGLHEIADLAGVAGRWLDYAKIAWGSSLITENLEQKLEAYRAAGITPMFGGTLFEYAYLSNAASKLLDVVKDTGVHIEISDGVADVPRSDKLRWIEAFAAHVDVFSEVGRKVGREEKDWSQMLREDLAAGAKKVVIEGRETGPAGQEIRADFVDGLVESVAVESLVFEALERKQQIWLIQRFGPNVNLGNILPPDVLTVESFRHGLKEHTLAARHRR